MLGAKHDRIHSPEYRPLAHGSQFNQVKPTLHSSYGAPYPLPLLPVLFDVEVGEGVVDEGEEVLLDSGEGVVLEVGERVVLDEEEGVLEEEEEVLGVREEVLGILERVRDKGKGVVLEVGEGVVLEEGERVTTPLSEPEESSHLEQSLPSHPS